MKNKRLFVKVSGIVQGVGFRPFVYNLACSLKLKGWVNNNSEGVYIDIEGFPEDINTFIYKLEHNAPPLSRIENISTEEMICADYESFDIKESERNETSITLISPDIALCEECREDILNPLNRRFGYPFTNCTNCGPRFSIIKSIPYDRDKTTMKKFKMCKPCMDEYTNPSNRRFHAQPNACSQCGPHIWAADSKNSRIETTASDLELIKWTAQKLNEGSIIALKGLTGFHLCCNAQDEAVVKLLRERKRRPHKPFAVMMKNMDIVKKYCCVSSKEEEVLKGIRKPIVLLQQKKGMSLPNSIAPGQSTLGVMLPYTPLHELLFNEDVEVLIMTSANINGLPLEYEDNSAYKNISSIADFFLFHNREVYIPVDDSVVKVVKDEVRMIRRARGYAPDPLKYNSIESILACGPNMKNTFCIGKDNFIFLSQHNGDLENLETLEHYKRNIEHFKNIFLFSPSHLACDMHPDYNSSLYAGEYHLPKLPVQHHHSHIASCMVENNINRKVIGVAFDGTGYGTDNKIWGGEFLLCDLTSFTRIGHLDYVKLPGGEKAVMEPWRMATSYISQCFNKNSSICTQYKLEEIISKLYGSNGLNVLKVLSLNYNNPETSSMGRLFDAVSSLCGIRDIITYEGQASIELEAVISYNNHDKYPYKINKLDQEYIIEPYEVITEIINDKLAGVEASEISAKFHNTVVCFTHELCSLIREETGINEVCLSGGVFQNSYLLEKLLEALEKDNFIVYSHRLIPSNDGGVSLGQIAIANEIIKQNIKY